MQLLTADIMETLLDFKNNTKINYDIYINNNNIYIRFHCGEIFEVRSMKKGHYDETTLRKYYDILKFTHDLSNKIINTINETQI